MMQLLYKNALESSDGLRWNLYYIVNILFSFPIKFV